MTQSANPDTYMLTSELAELTHTAAQTWRKKRWKGDGPPFIKIGNRVLYRRSDVEAWLAAHEFRSTAEF